MPDGQQRLLSTAEGAEREIQVAEGFRGLISAASPMGSAWQCRGLQGNDQCRAVQGGAMKIDGLLESQHVCLRSTPSRFTTLIPDGSP